MTAKELARLLMEFADLADFQRSDELYRLARLFENGRNETVLTRFKRMSPSTRHPSTLKGDVETIRRGLIAAGAKKQAGVLGDLLKLFGGPGGAPLDSFLEEICIEPEIPIFPIPKLKMANAGVVESIVGELRKTPPDADAFQEILAQLNSPAVVSASTLALIAKGVLGNGYIYRDRKTAIQAISKHFSRSFPPKMASRDPRSGHDLVR
jgi:hypothetical protein